MVRSLARLKRAFKKVNGLKAQDFFDLIDTFVDKMILNLVPSDVGLSDINIKAINIENPGGNEDITMFFTDTAITIKQLNAVLANGSVTPSVTWTIRHGIDRSAAGAEVVTGGTITTSVSAGSEVTSFNDETIVAGSWVWIETTAQSGTVPELNVAIKYTID